MCSHGLEALSLVLDETIPALQKLLYEFFSTYHYIGIRFNVLKSSEQV